MSCSQSEARKRYIFIGEDIWIGIGKGKGNTVKARPKTDQDQDQDQIVALTEVYGFAGFERVSPLNY